jgi:hypothetical protein
VHVVVPVEAAKRIERAIYVVDKIIRNLDWVAVINSIFGHGYCPQYAQQPGVFRSSNMYDSPFQVTKFDGIHVNHVAVLLWRRARPSLLPMGRSTKDLRASRLGRRDD